MIKKILLLGLIVLNLQHCFATGTYFHIINGKHITRYLKRQHNINLHQEWRSIRKLVEQVEGNQELLHVPEEAQSMLAPLYEKLNTAFQVLEKAYENNLYFSTLNLTDEDFSLAEAMLLPNLDDIFNGASREGDLVKLLKNNKTIQTETFPESENNFKSLLLATSTENKTATYLGFPKKELLKLIEEAIKAIFSESGIFKCILKKQDNTGYQLSKMPGLHFLIRYNTSRDEIKILRRFTHEALEEILSDDEEEKPQTQAVSWYWKMLGYKQKGINL